MQSPKPLQICLMTETYYPEVGGGETQTRSLAEGLAGNDIPVFVITRRSNDHFKKVEEYGQVMVHRVGPTGSQHYKKWGLILTTLPVLWRFRQHYDLIYVSGFRILGVPAVLISKLLGKRCVLKADSPGEMSGDFFTAGLARIGLSPRSLFFRPFLAVRNWLLRKADAFVAISTPLEQELREQGVVPDKIRMIPNSVDTDRFRPVSVEEKRHLRQELELPVEAKIAIFTGRLVSYKGLPLLLRVWREIQQAHPDARLLLVGAGGLDIHNCEDELREFVTKYELADSVHFTGAVGNVHEYLQAADIFVFPTEKEAFGISVIEAMACGLPLVATRIGGITDIVRENRDGLLIEAGNSTQLKQALVVLFENAPLAMEFGKKARQATQSRYATGQIVDAHLELFSQQIVGSGLGAGQAAG